MVGVWVVERLRVRLGGGGVLGELEPSFLYDGSNYLYDAVISGRY